MLLQGKNLLTGIIAWLHSLRLLYYLLNDACVRDCSGKPTATRYEWRGLGTESPTRLPAGHAQQCNNMFKFNTI